MGTVALSPGTNGPQRDPDQSPPSNAEVKNGGTIPPLPHMPSWHGDESTSLFTYSIKLLLGFEVIRL
jgi:hypothetical protein